VNANVDRMVVVVTGANGGLGAAIVEVLASHGATVVAHVRRADSLPDGAASTVVADLGDPSAAGRIMAETLSVHGRVDGLVNCAGVQPVVPFAAISDEDWQHMLDINLSAAHWLTQHAAAVMKAHGGGSIVHIASIEGSRPAVGHAHYAVSKAGLIMHAKAAALELGPIGVRVNAVSPGLLARQGLNDDWPEGVARWLQRAPLGRLGTGADVAQACAFLLSDEASFITGTNLIVDGGMSACPSW
jgi:NAD(P)-dependent dehydrogenase (short-subunit alcohol dehydrogenase family)